MHHSKPVLRLLLTMPDRLCSEHSLLLVLRHLLLHERLLLQI